MTQFYDQGSSVDYSGTGTAYRPNSSLYQRRDLLIETHSAWKERISEITSIVNGDWHMIWSNLTSTTEAPSVANIIELGIHHWSSLGGAVLPGAAGARGGKPASPRAIVFLPV